MQMLSSKDINFVGYTYKNFEIIDDNQLPGIGTSLHTFYNTFLLKSVLLISITYLKAKTFNRYFFSFFSPSHCP